MSELKSYLNDIALAIQVVERSSELINAQDYSDRIRRLPHKETLNVILREKYEYTFDIDIEKDCSFFFDVYLITKGSRSFSGMIDETIPISFSFSTPSHINKLLSSKIEKPIHLGGGTHTLKVEVPLKDAIFGNFRLTEGGSPYDEKIVGAWIDDTPVYQKIIKTSTPGSLDWSYVGATSEDIKQLISIEGFIDLVDDTQLIIPNNDINYLIGIKSVNNELQVKVNSYDKITNKTMYLIAKYIKKDDITIADKEVFDTENLYSTDEKIIGEWINGKRLYQKTFYVSTPTAANAWGNVKNVGNDIEQMVSFNAVMSLDDKTFIPIPHSEVDSLTGIRLQQSTGNIQIYTQQANFLNKPVYITMKYTRISDKPIDTSVPAYLNRDY